jgi:hypothetical protein
MLNYQRVNTKISTLMRKMVILIIKFGDTIVSDKAIVVNPRK